MRVLNCQCKKCSLQNMELLQNYCLLPNFRHLKETSDLEQYLQVKFPKGKCPGKKQKIWTAVYICMLKETRIQMGMCDDAGQMTPFRGNIVYHLLPLLVSDYCKGNDCQAYRAMAQILWFP